MLRHKMKAGIHRMGANQRVARQHLAEKRIEHTICQPIEHWSIWFDIKIMLLTFWRGFIHRHAY
ncbi:MAG: sugar transferase [Nitrospira sp.]|nr:sugar transferase [Nitrospira sp.]